MVGMALVKSLYAIPTWSRTARLIAEHPGLQAVLDCAPSVYACYRFAAKPRDYKSLLDACLDSVTAALHAEHPEMGRDVAIDGSDLPAYANGQRYLSKNGPEREHYSDPDASWGHRSAVSTRKGGGYYGYKVHAAVDAKYDLPLAWTVETASAAEQNFALGMIDATKARGFEVRTAIMDKGYDVGPIHDGCMDRGVCPVTSLKESSRTERGEHKPAVLRARHLDVRGRRLQASREQVALPFGRMLPGERVGQGRPAAPAHPARIRALAQALPLPWGGRARVRQAQARMGATAPSSPRP